MIMEGSSGRSAGHKRRNPKKDKGTAAPTSTSYLLTEPRALFQQLQGDLCMCPEWVLPGGVPVHEVGVAGGGQGLGSGAFHAVEEVTGEDE